MKPVWISQLGYSLPGPALAQEHVVEWMAPRLASGTDEARFRRFAARSGVSFRHSVLDLEGGEADVFYPLGGHGRPSHDRVSLAYAEKAPALATAAVRAACGEEDLGPISHLVVVTCTGAVAPGLDIALVRALGLGAGVRRTMVAFMGCYAAIPALRIARDTCRAEAGARVLVVCCELSSLHLEPGPHDEALIGACLFADGASAAIVEAGEEPRGLGLALGADCSLLTTDGEDSMAWRAGAHGFQLSLSPYVARAIGADLGELVQALASNDPFSVDWFVHPGGPRILDTFIQRLGLPSAAVATARRALDRAGNRSSATVLAMLSDAAADGWRGRGVLVGFGPGLTIDALAVERS